MSRARRRTSASAAASRGERHESAGLRARPLNAALCLRPYNNSKSLALQHQRCTSAAPPSQSQSLAPQGQVLKLPSIPCTSSPRHPSSTPFSAPCAVSFSPPPSRPLFVFSRLLCLLSPLLKSTKSSILARKPRLSSHFRIRPSLSTKLLHAPPLRVPRVSNVELHLRPHQKRAFPIPLVQKSVHCYSTTGYGRMKLLTSTA